MICSFVYLFVKLDNQGSTTFGSELMSLIRLTLAIIFPNVTVKRGLYNLKIRENEYCINSLNVILNTSYRKHQGYFAFTEPGIGMVFLLCAIQFLLLNAVLFGYEGRFYFNSRFLKKLKELVYYKLLKVDRSDLVKVPHKVKFIKYEVFRINLILMNW